MKILTLWEPWATYIALGVKTIETRSWATPYRGPVAIHAGRTGQTLPASEEHIRDVPELARRIPDPLWYPWPLGRVVAVAHLTACFSVAEVLREPAREQPGEVRDGDGHVRLISWADWRLGDLSAGRCGWAIEDVQKLAVPVAVRGQRGLLDLDPEDERRVRAALPSPCGVSGHTGADVRESPYLAGVAVSRSCNACSREGAARA